MTEQSLYEQVQGKRAAVLEAGISPASSSRILYNEKWDPLTSNVHKLVVGHVIETAVPTTGSELKAKMISLKVTNAQLSESSGITRSSISNITNEKRDPKWSLMCKLNAALPIEPGDNRAVSKADVADMRELVANGKTQEQIATQYEIGVSYVSKLISGKMIPAM